MRRGGPGGLGKDTVDELGERPAEMASGLGGSWDWIDGGRGRQMRGWRQTCKENKNWLRWFIMLSGSSAVSHDL